MDEIKQGVTRWFYRPLNGPSGKQYDLRGVVA